VAAKQQGRKIVKQATRAWLAAMTPRQR